MKKLVNILVISAKGQLLMQQAPGSPDEPGLITAFATSINPGELPVKAAVRGLAETTGLDARTDDLEFLDTYYMTTAADGEDAEVQTYIVAGVNEDRMYVYDGGELITVRRSDDFAAKNLSAVARKQAIDYFKRH